MQNAGSEKNIEAVGQSRRGNPEVVHADRAAGAGEASAELGVNSRNRSRDRNGVDCREKLLDYRSSLRPGRSARAVDAMEKLAHGDHADRPFLVADEFLDRPPGPLVLDEQISVDQDCQGSSA